MDHSMDAPETPQARYQIDIELRQELTGLLEDAVAHFCNQHMVSGELAWIIAECYSIAKAEQMQGNLK